MKRTSKNPGSNIRPVIWAALVASLLMLISGVGFRVLAAQLAAPGASPSVSSAALELLPLQIGAWTGQDKPLDEAIVRATDTDAHVSRTYAKPGMSGNVWLYVACGVNARDLMPHRPEVCYTGNGWRLDDRRFEELPLADGTKLPCNVFQFTRGSMSKERIMVLYYYIVDGQYSHDVSLLRSKAWRGSGTVRYVAQVQMAMPISSNMALDATARTISAFATESALPIRRLFDEDIGTTNLTN